MNFKWFLMFTICNIFAVTFTSAIANTAERILSTGESINVDLAKQDYKKISCGNGETPACMVYSSSGGFQFEISGKIIGQSSNFLQIARNIKAYQRQGKCEEVVISKIHQSPSELILYYGQSLLLDYSRGIKLVTCRTLKTSVKLEQCFITTHPISAASLQYKDFILDTSSALIRDDYRSLESKYSAILADIGLCSL